LFDTFCKCGLFVGWRKTAGWLLHFPRDEWQAQQYILIAKWTSNMLSWTGEIQRGRVFTSRILG